MDNLCGALCAVDANFSKLFSLLLVGGHHKTRVTTPLSSSLRSNFSFGTMRRTIQEGMSRYQLTRGVRGAGGLIGLPALYASNSSFASSSAVFMRQTAPLLKDIVKGDRGESRRLTFDERADRRLGKNRESRNTSEQKREEAENYVTQELPQTLEDLFTRYLGYCQAHHLKIVNLLKFLERAEVEITPGNKMLLLQLASIVKTGPSEIELTMQVPAHISIIFGRLMKLDNSLQPRRDGTSKLKVTVPPITTERREQAADAIRHTVADFKSKLKAQRVSAVKVLNHFGVDDNVLKQLTNDIDELIKNFTDDKVQELEQLAEEVVTATGVDEADV